MKKIAAFLPILLLASCGVDEEQVKKNNDFLVKHSCVTEGKNYKCANNYRFSSEDFEVYNENYFKDKDNFYKIEGEKFFLLPILERKINDIGYSFGLDKVSFEYVGGDIVKDKNSVYIVNSQKEEFPKKIELADASSFVMLEDGTFVDKNQGYDSDFNPIKK